MNKKQQQNIIYNMRKYWDKKRGSQNKKFLIVI